MIERSIWSLLIAVLASVMIVLAKVGGDWLMSETPYSWDDAKHDLISFLIMVAKAWGVAALAIAGIAVLLSPMILLIWLVGAF